MIIIHALQQSRMGRKIDGEQSCNDATRALAACVTDTPQRRRFVL
jgi:hypothetical protein